MFKNLTKKTIVSKSETYSQSYFDSLLGMILSRNKNGFFFKTNFGIHTFFMKEDVDVIVLDNNLRVMDLKKDIKPNRIFLWNVKYENVLELPAGSIKLSRTEVGDRLASDVIK
ncbi:MAG TPA: DUF192 domain-containing protein [Patescibacteria group bacterium]|nr:DUF192 domain-containing protein [Patescibacteria group bacterium]